MIMPHKKFKGHIDFVHTAMHLGGEQIMTCSADGSLRVWNLKTGKRIGDDWSDGDNAVWTIALFLDGKEVVSGSEDGVGLWDVENGETILAPIKRGHKHVHAAVYSLDMTVVMFATSGAK